METSQDYRQFAAECERLAEEAMTEAQRGILNRAAPPPDHPESGTGVRRLAPSAAKPAPCGAVRLALPARESHLRGANTLPRTVDTFQIVPSKMSIFRISK